MKTDRTYWMELVSADGLKWLEEITYDQALKPTSYTIRRALFKPFDWRAAREFGDGLLSAPLIETREYEYRGQVRDEGPRIIMTYREVIR